VAFRFRWLCHLPAIWCNGRGTDRMVVVLAGAAAGYGGDHMRPKPPVEPEPLTAGHPAALSPRLLASRPRYSRPFVLTARTEITDRMLIFGEGHLRTILAQYETHYNGRRPHRSRQLHPPRPDHPVADLSKERIQRRPVLGGLINEYERAA
jgi:hypothetical protein